MMRHWQCRAVYRQMPFAGVSAALRVGATELAARGLTHVDVCPQLALPSHRDLAR